MNSKVSIFSKIKSNQSLKFVLMSFSFVALFTLVMQGYVNDYFNREDWDYRPDIYFEYEDLNEETGGIDDTFKDYKFISGAVDYHTPIKQKTVTKFIQPDDNGVVYHYYYNLYDIGDMKTYFNGSNLSIITINYETDGPEKQELLGFFVTDDNGEIKAYDQKFLNVTGYYNADRIQSNFDLSDAVVESLDFIPKELFEYEFLVNNEINFSFDDFLYLQNGNSNKNEVLYTTETGLKITKGSKRDDSPSFIDYYDYFIEIPGVLKMPIELNGNFLIGDRFGIDNIEWDSPIEENSLMYDYGNGIRGDWDNDGWKDCFIGIDKDSFKSNLIRTGTTTSGEMIYEYNPKGFNGSEVYKCLYEETRRFEWNEDTGVASHPAPYSYEDFLNAKPLFFWKHPVGELVTFWGR